MSGRVPRLSLNDFYDVEEQRLRAKLDGVRLAISHAGEKGRVLENEVAAFIQSILPPEYGVSTGFIAHRDEHTLTLTPQLDIIIYDAIRCAPLIRYETCSVFALEAVYGYIEVKASLDSQSLSDIITKNTDIRRLTERWFWHPLPGSPPETILYRLPWLPVRSFVFSFSSRLGNGRALARSLERTLKEASESHLHGVFVAGRGLFSPHRVCGGSVFAEHPQGFFFTNTHALTAFKVLLVKCLATFPRCPVEYSPAVDRYHYDFVELSRSV